MKAMKYKTTILQKNPPFKRISLCFAFSAHQKSEREKMEAVTRRPRAEYTRNEEEKEKTQGETEKEGSRVR